MIVRVAEGVRFDRLTTELFWIAEAYWYAAMQEGTLGVITGAQDSTYNVGKAHRDGRALDFRSRDMHDPFRAAGMIRVLLKDRGLDATVLFGPPDHTDHIHVHYVPRGGA